MEKFNDDWKFLKLNTDSDIDSFYSHMSDAKSVTLPHDWLISNISKLYESSKGWYIKNFVCDKDPCKFDYLLRFGGIYMDSELYINKKKVFEWKYGYSSFEADITGYLTNGVNEIVVSANYITPNSRWYSGAGIYRDVYMDIVPKTHIVNDSLYFHANIMMCDIWKVYLNMELCLPENSHELQIQVDMESPACSRKCDVLHLPPVSLAAMDEPGRPVFEFEVANPCIWDIENPKMYKLRCSLLKKGECIHSISSDVGFRSIDIDPAHGFFLNGRRLKLKGVCEHTELGALGAAYNGAAMKRRLLILKKMGVNAIRFSHNMPDSHTLKLTDEMGFLVINEAFDMWESPKNKYDYSGFFKEWYKKDVKSWITRDRNHPSVIMWSIGNEIADTNLSDKGYDWCKRLLSEVDRYDPYRNAFRTMGSNYMPWSGAKKCAALLDLVGYNYGDRYYEEHHNAFPDWVIYGSETSSIAGSRGIYHFPYSSSILTESDRQCSGLGNSPTSWGAKSMEECLLNDVKYDFSAGQFIWSGFDYIGEPTPYHTKNSYLGQIDTAGFPKDSFYVVQSAWTDFTDSPVLHIYPYWDFNDGQVIDIIVASNAPVVELFINGKSQGTQELDKTGKGSFSGVWQIPYESGELTAIACDEKGSEVMRVSRHSFGNADRLAINTEYVCSDDSELIFAEIYTTDKDGYTVENANNYVCAEVTGGTVLCMDNGDSTDTDEYQTNVKRMFSGKVLAVIKPLPGTDTVVINACGNTLQGCEKTVHICKTAKPAQTGEEINAPCTPHRLESCKAENIPCTPHVHCTGTSDKYACADDEDKMHLILPRNIRLSSKSGMHLFPENMTAEVSAEILPAESPFKDIIFELTDERGIPTNIASISVKNNTAAITAKSDGIFRLRAMSACGTDNIRLISSLEFIVSGFGIANINPYEYVSAGRYDFCSGEIGNGNEKGVATARDGVSIFGFHSIDFGKSGSDVITLDIFALTDDEYEFEIYRGDDISSAVRIGKYIYQKPKIWNVYQRVTWGLDERLTGINSIFFLLKAKVHIKGFIFTEYNRAEHILSAADLSGVYGDSYRLEDNKVLNIKNNVTLEFGELDFDSFNASRLYISGATGALKTSILLEVANTSNTFPKKADAADSYREMLYFKKGISTQIFDIKKISSTANIKLIFLPGADFDFYEMKFLP